MIRVAIAGVAGRMGQTLVEAVRALEPEMQLTAASVLADDNSLGSDIGIVALGQALGVTAVADLSAVVNDFDMLIDFTSPKASLGHLQLCREHGKALVLGTTGFNAGERAEIKTATDLAIVFAPNMSVGVGGAPDHQANSLNSSYHAASGRVESRHSRNSHSSEGLQ